MHSNIGMQWYGCMLHVLLYIVINIVLYEPIYVQYIESETTACNS